MQFASGAPNSAPGQPSEISASNINGRVEITLANGRKLTLGATVDQMALMRLVQVLDRA